MTQTGWKLLAGMLAYWASGVLMAASMEAMAHEGGDSEAGRAKAAACESCHATDGNSSIAIYPKLAGQNAAYLNKHIAAFRDGERVDQSMQPMVQDLTDADIADLAAYYAGQTVQVGKADPELVDLGRNLYRFGEPARQIPACMACHGPAGKGNAPAGWPALTGQHADYVAGQLRDYGSGERATDPNMMMRDIATRMTEDEIEAVAQYVAGLH